MEHSLTDKTANRPVGPADWQLVAAICLIILSLVLGGFWFYTRQSDQIRREKSIELKTISELKIAQITQWRAERLGDARSNSEDPLFRAAVGRRLERPDDAALQADLRGSLRALNLRFQYANALLAAPDGSLLLSADAQVAETDLDQRRLAIESAASGEPQFGDFYRAEPGAGVYLNIAAPILDGDRPIAVLILQVDPDVYLYPLIQSWPTPSQSAETLLVRKDGEDALFLNTLRHDPAVPLTIRIHTSRMEVPAVKAVLGGQGAFEGVDYRGVRVLSELLPIPDSPWYMVAKVDAGEIFAEVALLGRVVAGFIGMAILLTAVLALLIFNRRRRRLYQALLLAERARSEAQEEIRTTLYSIGDGVITTDAAGCVTRLNPVAERLTGWSEAEALGRPLAEVFKIVNELTRAEVRNPVERVLADGIVVGLANHTLLIARDGSERPIADSGAPIRDGRGVSGVVLVFRDQTEERRAQKELVQLTDTIRASLNEIYLFDASTLRFRFVNDGALRNLGYTLEQMVQMTPLDLKPEFTPESFNRLIQPLIENREPKLVFETVHRRADGSDYPVEVHLQRYEYADGPVYLAIIQDISERRETEARLNDQLEELRRWHSATLGRETRIIELKREVNELLAKMGSPPHYTEIEEIR